MRIATALAVSCTLILGVAGCGEQADQVDRNVAAEGEILPGSISDEMLPYDTVRSQPPLLEPPKESDADEPGETGSDAAEEAGEEDSGDTAAAAVTEEEQQEDEPADTTPVEE